MGVVDEVKERLDIVEVVSSYVPLQKAGRYYKALCPFHAEKTPSFIVFPESQHWHCFAACGEGGDAFTFVMKQEGWDFRTALEELARRAGVELQQRSDAQQQEDQELERLRELLAAAARYYNHVLRQSAEAEAVRAYIARRGFSTETVERFLLGYSPSGWDKTQSHLSERGYTTDEQLKAGLLVQREERGSVYDRFRERLMIPIRDVRGRVIGFGARTLDPAGVPKYLNSPQTPLFDKSGTLFGLDLARQTIHRSDRAVIVEGYMDVMQAHQAGYANVVAQMGTALTEAQLQQLQRYTKRLVLALDPDAAGIRATLRGVDVARETLEQEWEPVFDPRGLVGYEAKLGTEIRVLRLPGGQDPDDVIRQDPQGWAELVEHALPVVDFYLQLLVDGLDLSDTKTKAQVVDKLLPVLRAVANPVEQEDYAQKIARALHLDARAVADRMRGAARQAAKRERGPARGREPHAGTGAPADLEGHCLSSLLERNGILALVDEMLRRAQVDPLHGRDFRDAGHRLVFETWAASLRGAQSDPLLALEGQLPPDVQVRLEAARVARRSSASLSDEQLARDVAKTVLRLREQALRRLSQDLRLVLIEDESNEAQGHQYGAAQLAYQRMVLQIHKARTQLGVG